MKKVVNSRGCHGKRSLTLNRNTGRLEKKRKRERWISKRRVCTVLVLVVLLVVAVMVVVGLGRSWTSCQWPLEWWCFGQIQVGELVIKGHAISR